MVVSKTLSEKPTAQVSTCKTTTETENEMTIEKMNSEAENTMQRQLAYFKSCAQLNLNYASSQQLKGLITGGEMETILRMNKEMLEVISDIKADYVPEA